MSAAVLVFTGAAAQGHGDGHEGIARLSQEIESRPEQAALHMERAGLYSVHGDHEKALADLAAVKALEPANDAAGALRGEVLRRMGRLPEARAEQEAFLQKHPLHAQVRWDYCRTLAESKDATGALRELDALISAAEHPAPDAVALRLSVTEATGADGREQALLWVNRFLEKHPLPVFQEHALRLEVALGRTAEARQRLDAMITTAPRKETLLLRKAALCQQSGDKAGAAAAALAAQEALARLPAHLRSTPATTALMQQVQQILSPP